MCAEVQLSSDERGSEQCHLCAKDRSAESRAPAAAHIYYAPHTWSTHMYIIRMARWEGSGTYVVTSQYVEQYPLHDDRKTCERRKSQYVSHLGVKG